MEVTKTGSHIEATDRTRTRLVWTFFLAVAIGQTGYLLAVTISSLAGGELASTSLSGLPSALGTVGIATGAIVFTWVAKRFGRTLSFTSGFGLAAFGATICAAAIVRGSFALLLGGMLVLGLGQSNVNLARYAAADLRPATQRAKTIGLLVWAGTIGAVLGPRSLKPAGDAAIALGYEDLVGPYLGGALLFIVGAAIFGAFLRPDPVKLAIAETDQELAAAGTERSRSLLLSLNQTKLALVAMGLSQAVMALVMVQTPLHLREIGEGLDVIGNVMTAHTLGMFAIAPVTGYLVARLGSRHMIAIGSGVLILSCFMAFFGADPQRTSWLLPALLLLGVGWNFCFVAGSTLLMDGLAFQERLNVQGVGDAMTRMAGGIASVVSGVVVAATSYSSLSMIGGVMSLIPLAALIAWGRPKRPAEVSVTI